MSRAVDRVRWVSVTSHNDEWFGVVLIATRDNDGVAQRRTLRVFVDNHVWIWHNAGMATLFVYGTLMKGMRNHIYLEKAQFLGEGTTQPVFELLSNGSIPAMRDGSEAVKGELYEVDEETLKSLDMLEEVSSELYEKREIEVSGKKATAYLGKSIFNFDTWEKIPNGDYKPLGEAQQKTA
jgi:gamma-glutamylcyclotransferase (GGCT)/AIG2-like uncharacterized protein YtfP